MVDIVNELAEPMEENLSVRRVQRVRHEIKKRELTVRRVEALSPHVRRVVLGGESLHDFVSASFDDHLKLILEAPGGGEPLRRDYTPRHFDREARELTIEFALHGDGPAARWAEQAAAGQAVTIAGPRGSMIIPLDYHWHLLVGDETALPAIARRLEELPASAQAIVIVRSADAADRRALASAAQVTLRWVDDDLALVAAVRALDLPAGEGFAWCAGERQVAAALRQVLVAEKGHDRYALRASAYWKHGAAAHHEDIDD